MKAKNYLIATLLLVITAVAATFKNHQLYGFEKVDWLWVFLPLWIYPAAILATALIYLICVGILKLYGKEVRNARK